ncbi:hypothetical protein SAMN05421757_103367 [Tropicimonas sediminicola]|uniref:Uncharacterized protein n=2 Tax=Tropicimonas sediminicola TaxID=1031541 RepID=A0A239HE87_9RHOB|nr:hypothetical protein SAMN05421757_103367 [Tropicimonas sediminicola]
MPVRIPALMALLASTCTPAATWGDQAAIAVCTDYVMQICGPDTPPGMTLLGAFGLGAATRVSLRDGAGEIWQCSGQANGLIDDVEMAEFPEPRPVRLAAGAPSAVLQDTIATSEATQYVVPLIAGQHLFARVVELSPGLILEVRDPDGQPLALRTVTDRVFLDRAERSGDYAVRLINHGTASASPLSIIAVY